MKKVAIYVRVSTQEQVVEGYSISEQIDRLTKFCEAHSWKIYKVYTDPGFSGRNMNRPSLQKLFADCTQKRFDTVLVYKLDRLSRSQKDTPILSRTFSLQTMRISSPCRKILIPVPRLGGP